MTTLDPREIAFRQFWSNYPRKVAIAEARVAFARAIQSHLAADIIEGAHRYAMDANRDETYTPYPVKWLNNIGWMDGPLPPRKLTPDEVAQRDIARTKTRDEAEKARSTAMGLEFKAMKARAVPMPDNMREIIQEIRRSHETTK